MWGAGGCGQASLAVWYEGPGEWREGVWREWGGREMGSRERGGGMDRVEGGKLPGRSRLGKGGMHCMEGWERERTRERERQRERWGKGGQEGVGGCGWTNLAV